MLNTQLMFYIDIHKCDLIFSVQCIFFSWSTFPFVAYYKPILGTFMAIGGHCSSVGFMVCILMAQITFIYLIVLLSNVYIAVFWFDNIHLVTTLGTRCNHGVL